MRPHVTSSIDCQPAGPSRQSGFGLLQALLLVVLIGAAVVAGVTLLRADAPSGQAAQQEDALRWADEALVAFAAAHAHLPCPVSGPTAPASACVGPGEKGWLPTRALEAVHPGGAAPTQPLRYVVYRGGTSSDLAVASNTFSPHTWERTQHNLDPINGLDLCASLANASRETRAALQGGRARTLDAAGATVNIAYGLIAAGPTPGAAGGRFDGANQNADAMVEAPSRDIDSSYDDRTRVRDFNSLAQSLGCGFADPANPDGLAIAAVDMLALAVDVSDEVTEQHEGNKEDTQLAVGMASGSVVFAGIGVALAGASIANSVSTLATASTQLSAAIASCVVLVGCGLIPPYTAAVIAAGVAIGLASTATGLAAAALIASSVALGLTVEARDMAQQGLPSATIDLSSAVERTCVSAEGGFVNYRADANGNLIPIHPPEFRPGLRQEVAATAAELVDIDARTEANRLRVAALEQIPSVELIDYPPEPVRQQGESDADWAARYQAWLDSRRNAETMLQAKLEAIRIAKRAQFDWDIAVQTATNAQKELDAMNASVAQLILEVGRCDTSPPGDIANVQRCANLRTSLRGLTTCDATVLTARQVLDRQCLPWKQADRDAAVANRDAAYTTYDNAERHAVGMPQPLIKDYISDSGWFTGTWDCGVFDWCDPLIVYRQRDSDKRETYAKLVYQSFGLQVARREKETELDEKQAAYDTAQAECDALRALQAGGGVGGTEAPPVWAGANAIMQAANCRGATGAVQPATCGGTP